MGLIQEVQDLKNTLKRQNDEKQDLQKEVENLRNKLDGNHLTKERKNELELALYNDFDNQFTNYNENIYTLEEVEKNILSIDNRNETCFRLAKQNNISERYFIDTIYEKLYKKAKKRYILSQEAIRTYNEKQNKEEMQAELEKLKQQKKEQEKQEKITNILYIICNLLFSPLTIIIFIIILLLLGYFNIALPILKT